MLFEAFGDDRRVIIAVAAPAEARAVLAPFGVAATLVDRPWELHRLSDCVDLIVTGVGKVNAAGGLAHVWDPAVHAAVVSAGVAGALPGSGVEVGSVVVAETSVYADEGLIGPDGFSDCESMGFPLGPFRGNSIVHDVDMVRALRPLADHVGVIATVSTCSGTDVAAREVVSRTGALAESMEGAALGHAASRLGLRSAEIRAISNTTGDRDSQVWDLELALESLTRVFESGFVR